MFMVSLPFTTNVARAQADATSSDKTRVRSDTANSPGTSAVLADDAFVRSVFMSGDSSRFGAGAEAYLRLLTARDLTPIEEEIVHIHMGLALEVIPRSDRPAGSQAGRALETVGERVALWWRRQDPFPSTRRNERLEEHLSRWAFALDAFESKRDEWGFDDRGPIYVRFGPPGKRLSVRIDESRRAFAYSTSLIVPDLPESEMWVYRHVHDEAYYFFARDSKRGGYRLAYPSETIPSRLLAGMDYRNSRGQQKADVLLTLMEEVYAQLALAHPIFGSTYDQIVSHRISLQSSLRPDVFARSALTTASTIETESADRRNDIVPASFSDTIGLTEELPLESRWARFLEPDGSTRTEIYWSVDSARLEPSRRLERALVDQGFTPSNRFLLAVAVVRQTEDYRPRDVQTKHYLVDPTPEKTLRAQSFIVRGDTGIYNVAAQWTQHWTTNTEDGELGEGAILKRAIIQLDTLRALNGREERLEVSDLKPVFPTSADVPYPFRQIDPMAPPDLYFEVYNLHYGPDDQTKYTIEYEVTGLTGDSREPTGMSTSARTTYSGTGRIAQERIGLDLGDWRDREAVRITVRATDDVTSDQIARSIIFTLDS
jgi:GWxTD domain-containing protein